MTLPFFGFSVTVSSFSFSTSLPASRAAVSAWRSASSWRRCSSMARDGLLGAADVLGFLHRPADAASDGRRAADGPEADSLAAEQCADQGDPDRDGGLKPGAGLPAAHSVRPSASRAAASPRAPPASVRTSSAGPRPPRRAFARRVLQARAEVALRFVGRRDLARRGTLHQIRAFRWPPARCRTVCSRPRSSSPWSPDRAPPRRSRRRARSVWRASGVSSTRSASAQSTGTGPSVTGTIKATVRVDVDAHPGVGEPHIGRPVHDRASAAARRTRAR